MKTSTQNSFGNVVKRVVQPEQTCSDLFYQTDHVIDHADKFQAKE